MTTNLSRHRRITWGKLILIDQYDELVSKKSNGVTDTLAVRFLEFRCECGKGFVIEKSKFPGRRKMRDCGCGIAAAPGTNTITSVYMEESIKLRVFEYAKSNHLSLSKAINVICSRALSGKPLHNVSPTSEESDV